MSTFQRDFKLVPTLEGDFDFSFSSTDIETVDNLSPNVLASIFTKVGYWGDAISDFENDESGADLSLFERSKFTSETIESFRFSLQQSLNWMVLDGIASAVNVFSTQTSTGVSFRISIERQEENSNFELLWDGQEGFQNFELIHEV